MSLKTLAQTLVLVAGFIATPVLAETVKVSLVDDAIKVTPATIKAGKITFDVMNDSMTEMHEVFVADKPAGEIPFDKAKDRVIESKLKRYGEVADIKPGAGGKLTATLKPGTYVLICNIKGHFSHGMKAELTVTP